MNGGMAGGFPTAGHIQTAEIMIPPQITMEEQEVRQAFFIVRRNKHAVRKC